METLTGLKSPNAGYSCACAVMHKSALHSFSVPELGSECFPDAVCYLYLIVLLSFSLEEFWVLVYGC